jgi:hypothetical protein
MVLVSYASLEPPNGESCPCLLLMGGIGPTRPISEPASKVSSGHHGKVDRGGERPLCLGKRTFAGPDDNGQDASIPAIRATAVEPAGFEP